MRDVTRFLNRNEVASDDRFHKREKQIELYRSINIRCDDVLENLRKATPCFITGAFGQESWTADNSEQGQFVVIDGPGNAS
jgi:single-stranded DNA-binding protein